MLQRQLPTCAETIEMLQSFQSHPHSGLSQREINSEADSHVWFLGSYSRTDQPSPDQFLGNALLSPPHCGVTARGFHGSVWTVCCSTSRLQLAKSWSEGKFITKRCSSISQLPCCLYLQGIQCLLAERGEFGKRLVLNYHGKFLSIRCGTQNQNVCIKSNNPDILASCHNK